MDHERGPGTRQITGDRRRPVARYVVFSDPTTQAAFIAAAEAAYGTLVRASSWRGSVAFALPSSETVTVTERRGLRRRTLEQPAPPRVLSLAPGLAEAAGTALAVPAQLDDLGGCDAGRHLGRCLAEVVLDLVCDLGRLPAEEQPAHPAYRQTQRLAAELAALHRVSVAVGCRQPGGCVAARRPDQWGRRLEDVEVGEVQAVLLQLARSTAGAGARSRS